MGLILQLEDGHFYLEDLSSTIPVDLSQAISFHSVVRFLASSLHVS